MIGIYVLSVVGIYFSVGLAACADLIFRGKEATVGDGMAVANSALRARSAAGRRSRPRSGVIVGLLESQGGALGEIAGRLVGTAWSLVTFLSVPVIAIEGTGPVDTLKRSASLFQARWGQQITGNIAIGGAVFLIGFLPAAGLIVVGVVIWPSAGFAGALLVVIGALIVLRRAGDLEGAQRHLRSRPLPLRARRRGGRRLHPGRPGERREARSAAPSTRARPRARSEADGAARRSSTRRPTRPTAVLGAMRAVALEHGGPGLTEMDRETIGSAALIVFGLGEVEVDALATVDPAGLAAATNRCRGRGAARCAMLSVMSLADGEIDAEKTALVRAYADALGVEADYLDILTEAAADEIAQAAACIVPQERRELPPRRLEPSLGQRDRPLLPLQRRLRTRSSRPATRPSASSPPTASATPSSSHFQKNGFFFPGNPDGLAEGFTTPHDSSHVLSGYSTSEGGEICVSTFIGAMHPDHPMAAEVLPVIFSWHLGVKLNDIANSTTGVFEPRHFWTAWERGAATHRGRRRRRLGLLGRDDGAAGRPARRLRRAAGRPGDAGVALSTLTLPWQSQV